MTDIKKELDLDELEEVSGGRRLETTKFFSYVMAGEDSLKSVAAKFATTEDELIGFAEQILDDTDF